ncbi:MAG TPA: 30S ribosomal protein S16 [Candidatus Dojkabacteria bacterium]|jgi:small subunit ribosomal protein S16
MVKLRLKRMGKKNAPFYRIVAIPARSKREGKSLEDLGFYDPMNKKTEVKKDRIEYWLSVGAQPTYSVERILIREKVLKEAKISKKTFSKEAGEKSKARKAKLEEKASASKEEKTEVKEKTTEEKPEEVKEQAVAESVEETIAEEVKE